MQNKTEFFRLSDGRQATLYVIGNGQMQAKISDWGGTLVELIVPDKNGRATDVILRHDKPQTYVKNPGYLGALVGRYANRICGGKFKLDGKLYQVPRNERGRTSLHGGDGYSHRIWTVKKYTADTLVLTIDSPDGDAGYPGNLHLQVTYKVTENQALQLDYEATCDQNTVANFTNHAYFNLSGSAATDILATKLKIDADFVTEVNKSNIPTGFLLRTKDTAFDLHSLTALGKCFKKLPRGYDHNFILNDHCRDLSHPAVVAECPVSGIKLQCFTTEPGVQLYTAGYMNNRFHLSGKVGGRPFLGFCLEAQHAPDSPNHPEWPSVVLKKGDRYRQTTIYQFGLLK